MGDTPANVAEIGKGWRALLRSDTNDPAQWDNSIPAQTAAILAPAGSPDSPR